MAKQSFDDLNEAMLKRFFKINPDAATGMGVHDPYDWEMPHGGFKAAEDTATLLVEWSKKAHQLAKSEHLSSDQMLSLKVIDLSIDMLRFAAEDYPLWKMYPDGLQSPGGLLFVMFSREYAPFETRIDAISSRLGKLPKYLKEYRQRFDGDKTVRVWTHMAIETCYQIPAFVKFIESSAKGKVSDRLAKELSVNAAAAIKAIQVQREWLTKMLEKPDMDYAMGKEKLAKLVKLRGIDLTPKEMHALGEKYLKDLKAERLAVAKRIAPGKGLKEATEIVKADCPKDFEAALKATEDEMNSAKEFIIENGIATIDESAVLKVVETPAFLAPLLPFAALIMPSKFDKRQEGGYLVTRPKNVKDLSSHSNYASIINTAVHEAYPGHFHQGTRTNTKHWMLQLHQVLPAEGVTCGTETVEGWAHYCEKMMFDHGYRATDAAALEMLNGAIWRACRIIADIELAEGRATIEQMVEMFVRETGMPRDAMEAEVKRYTHTPSQALSYMVGRHLVIEFRKEMEKSLGKKFDEKKFHDLIADYGYLPLRFVKEAVKNGMR